MRKAGIQNILALRGDPPKGQETFTTIEGGFSCALDLVRYIRKEHGDYFGIGVAGYPEAHPDRIVDDPEEMKARMGRGRGAGGWQANLAGAVHVICGPTRPSRLPAVVPTHAPALCTSSGTPQANYWKDIAYLKEKMDAGADFVVTQLFYEVERYTQVGACWPRGMAVPGREHASASMWGPLLTLPFASHRWGHLERFQAWREPAVPSVVPHPTPASCSLPFPSLSRTAAAWASLRPSCRASCPSWHTAGSSA